MPVYCSLRTLSGPTRAFYPVQSTLNYELKIPMVSLVHRFAVTYPCAIFLVWPADTLRPGCQEPQVLWHMIESYVLIDFGD